MSTNYQEYIIKEEREYRMHLYQALNVCEESRALECIWKWSSNNYHSKRVTLRTHSTQSMGMFNTLFSLLLCTLVITKVEGCNTHSRIWPHPQVLHLPTLFCNWKRRRGKALCPFILAGIREHREGESLGTLLNRIHSLQFCPPTRHIGGIESW